MRVVTFIRLDIQQQPDAVVLRQLCACLAFTPSGHPPRPAMPLRPGPFPRLFTLESRPSASIRPPAALRRTIPLRYSTHVVAASSN
jgi:hypothetical protein